MKPNLTTEVSTISTTLFKNEWISSLDLSTHRLIDFRNVEDYTNQKIGTAFNVPLNQFPKRSEFPWFLLPERSIPFSILIPPLNSDLVTPRDYEQAIGAIQFDSQYEFPCEQKQADRFSLFLKHLIYHSEWKVKYVFITTSNFWESCRSHGVLHSSMNKESDFIAPPVRSKPLLPFSAAKVLVKSLPILFQDPYFPPCNARIVDLGCGSGRDLAWLLYEYSNRFHTAVAIDSWKGSCDRVYQLAHFLGMHPQVEIIRACMKEFGIIKQLEWKHPFCQTALDLTQIMNAPVNLIILNRFLPPRSFVSQLHAWCHRPGTFLLLSTFIKPNRMTLNDWVDHYGTPTNHSNLLIENELEKPQNPTLISASESTIVQQLDKWGWGFNHDNGYEILKNETCLLPDNRPIVYFLVKKL